MTGKKISESRFYMWRAVVAMAHADSVVRPHEIHFILENTKKLPLDETQRDVLTKDTETPADIRWLFSKIKHEDDRQDFFHLARALSWSDGHFDEREQELLRLVGASAQGRDSEAIKISQRNFRDVYIEGKKEGTDKTLSDIIKGLISRT